MENDLKEIIERYQSKQNKNQMTNEKHVYVEKSDYRPITFKRLLAKRIPNENNKNEIIDSLEIKKSS